MKRLNTSKLMIAAGTLAATTLAGSANAATIVYDFTGATATGDGSTDGVSSNDFGSGVSAGEFTLVDGSGSGGFVDGFHDDRAEIVLKGFLTTWTFTVTIPNGVTVDLTQLAFDDGIQWTNSRSNATYSQWTVSIDNGGTATPNSVTDSRANPLDVGEQSKNNVLALSGLTGLTDTTVTITINGQFGVNTDFTSGNDQTRQAFIDNVTLTGTTGAVPEPGSLALLGLGGLCMLRRRRA